MKRRMFFIVCICESSFTVTTDKTYFIIITKELHRIEASSMEKRPSIGFQKLDPMPGNITAGQESKETSHSCSVIYKILVWQ